MRSLLRRDLLAMTYHMEQTSDIKENKVIAALSYVSILCFVSLYLKKNSPFAQFHGRQGFTLFALGVALWIFSWFPIIGWMVWMLGSLVVVVFSIMGFAKALQGQLWELPFLGSIAKKLEF